MCVATKHDAKLTFTNLVFANICQHFADFFIDFNHCIALAMNQKMTKTKQKNKKFRTIH